MISITKEKSILTWHNYQYIICKKQDKADKYGGYKGMSYYKKPIVNILDVNSRKILYNIFIFS